jgi:hypothetical protein
MTQAARSNLQLRRPPTATTASSRTTPLRSCGAPIGWPCWSPATPPARPSTSRPNYRPRSSLVLMSRYWARSSPAPLCRVLPHQRVLKRTYPDCCFGRRGAARRANLVAAAVGACASRRRGHSRCRPSSEGYVAGAGGRPHFAGRQRRTFWSTRAYMSVPEIVARLWRFLRACTETGSSDAKPNRR